ncbi:MAG TPA: hypothetical protein GXX29_00540 [Firmicutes bacterium]|nr:hypothetical protein [Bacillota bacterium]
MKKDSGGLKARSAGERLAAVRSFCNSAAGKEEKMATLQPLLNDRSNLVVAEVVKGLAALEEPGVVPALAATYLRLAEDGPKRDAGCRTRLAIVEALPKLRAIEAADILHHAIKTVQVERSGCGFEDMAVPLRAQAAAAMASLRCRGALPAISLLLFDMKAHAPHAPEDRLFSNMAARLAAAESLAVLGDPGGVAVLAVKLALHEEETAEVIVACFDALAELDAEMALEQLPPFLHHHDAYIVAGAATALASLPAVYQPKVLELLAERVEKAGSTIVAPTAAFTAAAHTATADTVTALTLAIAAIRSENAVTVLEGLAGHSLRQIRTAAIAALRQRSDQAAAEVLQRLEHRHR